MNVSRAGLLYRVDFSNNAISNAKRKTFDVNLTGAHQVLAGAHQRISAVWLRGDYALSLSLAEPAWKKTTSGNAAALHETRVVVREPFQEAPEVYWVNFFRPEPARHGLAVGCGLSRSFAVDMKKHTVTPLKPVC